MLKAESIAYQYVYMWNSYICMINIKLNFGQQTFINTEFNSLIIWWVFLE